MALFKIFNNIDIQEGKTTRNNLPDTTHKGYCYFDANTNLFYIDIKDSNGVLSDIYDDEYRVALNAYSAKYDGNGEDITANISSIKTNYVSNNYLSETLAQYAGKDSIIIKQFVLSSSGWTNRLQSITIDEALSSSIIAVNPAEEDLYTYMNNKVIVNTINDDLITFSCSYNPSEDISITVFIFNDVNTTSSYNIEDLSFDFISKWERTGSEITPEVDIYNKKYKLIKDIDYTLSYANNIELGQGKIIIAGIGDYSGTKTVNFDIIYFPNVAELDWFNLPETALSFTVVQEG